MTNMRIALFAACVAVFMGMNGSHVLAKPETSFIGDASMIELDQSKLPLTLRIGAIEGKLEATALDSAYTEGDSAFVQLTLSSETTRRRGDAAVISLETELGEITSIFGNGVKSREDGEKRIIEVSGITKKRSRRVLVEMKLRSDGDTPVNTMRLALRLPEKDDKSDRAGQAAQTISLSWPVNSCGRDYHNALMKIGEAGGNSLRDSWVEARTPLKSMSRRWYFRPAVPRRSSRRGDQGGTDLVSRSRVRAIFVETARLMGRGYDRIIARKGRYGWPITKTTLDLKKYFSQDFNPAICTGGPGFADYYEDQMSPLGDRSIELARLAGDARVLARVRAVDFVETTRNLPGGHPNWGGAGLDALKTIASASGDDLKSLIIRMLQAGGADQDIIKELAAAKDTYSAIRIIDKIGLRKAGVSSKSHRSELGQAIAANEAAIRLAAYRDQYDMFWEHLTELLTAIRDAHSEHCTCKSQIVSR